MTRIRAVIECDACTKEQFAMMFTTFYDLTESIRHFEETRANGWTRTRGTRIGDWLHYCPACSRKSAALTTPPKSPTPAATALGLDPRD